MANPVSSIEDRKPQPDLVVINYIIKISQMETRSEERRKKNYTMMRSIVDYGMGLVIFGFGIFFMVAPRLGKQFDIEPVLMYFFAGLCIIYGGWRIYRGYKKNYYSE